VHGSGSSRCRRIYAGCQTGMIPDLDIWRAANLVAKAEGVEAEDYANLMISRCTSWGYEDGVKLWLRIRQVIRELQATPSGLAH
jgi:hypothetical protein